MDGLAGVSQRMSEIQGALSALTRTTTQPTAPATTRTSATSAPASPAEPSTTSSAFEQALATAQTAAAPGATYATPGLKSTDQRSTVGALAGRGSGRLDPHGVPTDLAAYGNGRIPTTALRSIGSGSHRLWAPAAESFKALKAAASSEGVRIGVSDSYRSFDEQVSVARRKGLYSQGGLAAKPGTSEHGWGRSVDLVLDSRAQRWMRANAGEYGFAENVPREPWHWTYSPS